MRAAERLRAGMRLPRLGVSASRYVMACAPREFSTVVGLQLLAAGCLTGQLVIGRRVLEVLLGSTGTPEIDDVLPGLLLLAATAAVTSFAAAAASERQHLVAELVEQATIGRVLDVAMRADLASFDDPTFHDRLQRARHDAVQRPWQLTFGLLGLLSGATGIIAAGVVLASISPLLLPVVLCAYAPLWLVTRHNSRAFFDFSRRTTSLDRERRYLESTLISRREAMEVRAFQMQGFLRRRFDVLTAERIAQLRRLSSTRLRWSLAGNVGASAVTVGALGVVIRLATQDNGITLADAGVAAIALQQVGARLRAAGSGGGSLGECALFLADLESFIAAPASSTADEATDRLSLDEITVERVSFRYPGTEHDVLRDVTLSARKGEVVAILGRNGSGKTTLLKLLLGLHRPDSGVIAWDGTPIDELGIARVRSSSSVVLQDFARYELAAELNIALGASDRIADVDAVHRAARAASAHDLLSSLPMGYATVLSRSFSGGAELSTGEWQRVAVARALFRDAPLLILDEPTSALDPDAELELFRRLHELAAERAVVVITHRAAAAVAADRVYVLDRGRVIESGEPRALRATGGTFARIAEDEPAAGRRLAEPEGT